MSYVLFFDSFLVSLPVPTGKTAGSRRPVRSQEVTTELGLPFLSEQSRVQQFPAAAAPLRGADSAAMGLAQCRLTPVCVGLTAQHRPLAPPKKIQYLLLLLSQGRVLN